MEGAEEHRQTRLETLASGHVAVLGYLNINNRHQNQNRKLNNGMLVHVHCMSVGVLLAAGTQ